MEIVLLGAMTSSGGVGYDDKLPWSIPDEMRHFKNVTSQPKVAVVTSNKTLTSIPNKLIGRNVYSLSSKYKEPVFKDTHVKTLGAVDDIIEHALEAGYKRLYVIGGPTIWDAFKDHYDRYMVSVVHDSGLKHEPNVHYRLPNLSKMIVVQNTLHNGFYLVEYEKVDHYVK